MIVPQRQDNSFFYSNVESIGTSLPGLISQSLLFQFVQRQHYNGIDSNPPPVCGISYLRSRVNRELELALFPVIVAQLLHEQRREARSGAAAERVKNEKALQTVALIREAPDPVRHAVDDLLAHRVVAARVIVGRVLLAADQLFRMVQLPVGTVPNLICNRNVYLNS